MTQTTTTKSARGTKAANIANVQLEELDALASVDVNAEDNDFSWDALMSETPATRSTKDIVKECLADKSFKLFRGLSVKNVKTVVYLSKATKKVTTRITFILKDKNVPGMVVTDKVLDEFGEPTKQVGMSPNVFSSAIAVSGAMKEDDKQVFFADKVAKLTAPIVDGEFELVGKDNLPNVLYAGGTIDVLCQYVPAGQPYVNPFSSNKDGEPTIFDENRIFHHVVALTNGTIGNRVIDNLIDSL